MMRTTIELAVKGPDCAVCADKINEKINKIEDVKSASLNAASGILIIELADENSRDRVIERTKKIISRIEPDAAVSERTERKNIKKELILEGLDCANCASEIENKTAKLDGVKSARIDFAAGKLVLELNSRDADSVIESIKKLIKKIEPDAAVKETAHKARGDRGESAAESRKKLFRLALSGSLFAAALIFTFSNQWEFALFFASYLIAGGKVILRAAKDIKNGRLFDESFLMSIATIGAFVLGAYAEGAAVMLFYQTGMFFQDSAVNRSRRSISALMDIRPDYAVLKAGNALKRVSPDEVKIGDFIIVKPGEKIPLDGAVVKGISMVDTSALTGEPVPLKAEPGSEVYGGSINKNGLLTIEVKKEFGESAVSKILRLVENAGSRKAPTEQFITKFARVYTPFVAAAALLLAVVPPLFIEGEVFSEWIYRALVFLVISCPCALVISIPLGFFGGIGGASRNGILIKGGNYLEALNNVDTVVFDKTGTLTKGVFGVTKINPVKGTSEDELLEKTAYAEYYSNHPIARSVIKAYGREIDKSIISGHEEFPGRGVTADIKGMKIFAGNAEFMAERKIKFDPDSGADTVVYTAVNGAYAGSVVISDEIKKDTENLVRGLKETGVKRAVMLTGDNRSAGEKTGRQLKMDTVYSGLLPDQKVEKLEQLYREKNSKGSIVFAGDGINDAPVLARADVGVAMGGLGSDAAIEAADVVLMTDEPGKLISAIKISKRTRRIVIQNITLAFAVKGIVLILGAGGLAAMWEAVFADVGVAVIAVLNAMRVMHTKI